MNVNITLVTTSTWPVVGPRRWARGVVRVPDEPKRDSEGSKGGSPAAIRIAFPGTRSSGIGQVANYSGLAAPASRGSGNLEWIRCSIVARKRRANVAPPWLGAGEI